MTVLESSEFSRVVSSVCDHEPVLYASQVTHVRRSPIAHQFRYKASYWLVDFDRLPRPGGILGALARFEGGDHSDIRAFLAQHGIEAEHILMLALPRTWGYVFNPISIFWCYDVNGARLAVAAEVQNTYGGRHTYLLRSDEHGCSRVDKAMYVSPFYPVDGHYEMRVSEPGTSVSVTVILRREGEPPFVATLRGERYVGNAFRLIWASLNHPALRTSGLIRWQAFRLWLRGLKVEKR